MPKKDIPEGSVKIEFDIQVTKGGKQIELLIRSKYPISFDEMHAIVDEIQVMQMQDDDIQLN